MKESDVRPWVIIGYALLWTYAAAVWLYGEQVVGVRLGVPTWFVLLLVGYVLIPSILRWGRRRIGISESHFNNIAVACISLLVSLVAADTAFAVYRNAHRPVDRDEMLRYERLTDKYIWDGELQPRFFFPTDRDFIVYKPGTRTEGTTYGEFYETSMLASPTLRDSVLELRHLIYEIDSHGFREHTPIAEARVFALGDSFVFGYGIEEGNTWHEILEQSLGLPIYAIGLSASGPRPELMALEYVLDANRDSVRIDHLLWMLFEGNDLENSYVEYREAPSRKMQLTLLLRGSVFDVIASAPGFVKQQSLSYSLANGEVTFGRGTAPGLQGARYQVDGVELAYPLYHSKQWGYKLFSPFDIVRATRSSSYVSEHPNRTALNQTFQEMRSLANEMGFKVTVLIAPSAARVYGATFDGFPRLSEVPHFINYVSALSNEMGFHVVDLLAGMAPQAAQELLYFRDDHHWNRRGNAVAAEVIRREVVF